MLAAVVGVAAVALLHAARTRDPNVDEDTNAVASLRRELMRDNYDYVHDAKQNETIRNKEETKRNNNIDAEFENIEINNGHTGDIRYRARDETTDEIYNEPEDVEGPLFGAKEHLTTNLLVTRSTVSINSVVPQNKSVKYKMLRRRSRAGRLKFIQEEAEGGVSIVQLGNRPLPPLRLPSGRRQYMDSQGDMHSDDEELPPPSLN